MPRQHDTALLRIGVPLARAPRVMPSRAGAATASRPPRPAPPLRKWLRALLRAPLAVKLVGANAVVVATAAWGLFSHGARHEATDSWETLVLAIALAAGVVVNWALVRLALRPLHELEEAAERVWRGDLAARVPASPIADEDFARVGGTVNRLLDGLAADRAQMRELAAEVIESADVERSRIARELHDSVAQTLAALGFQVAAAARDSKDPELGERLAVIRELAGAALEEVRALSHSVYPRVLDDLGLAAALEWLARQTRDRSTTLDVRVTAADGAAHVAAAAPRMVGSALYRVAQEALRNVERHAGASVVNMTLSSTGDALRLVVADDGAGFDVAAAEARRPGMGLASMRERVALAGGTLTVDSAPGRGTQVAATVPLHLDSHLTTRGSNGGRSDE